MNMQRHRISKLKHSLLLLLLLPGPSFASVYYYMYLGGSIGGSSGQISASDPTITYADGTITDAYPLNRRNSIRSILSLNGGYELMGREGNPTFDIGIGVYSTPTGYAYNGNLIETAAGGSGVTLYNYSYRVSSTRLMLEGQINFILGDFSPFINAGIGSAWNNATSYDESPAGGTTYPPLPSFANKSMNNLAYQGGVGISYAFSTGAYQEDAFKPERLSLGYRYTNLGSAEFGTRGATYPYPLNIGTLTTNDIYLSYTHFF
jgi:hypothetical protein